MFFLIIALTVINCKILCSCDKEFYCSKDSSETKIFVNKILIIGNDVTKEEVILREIRTKENDTTNIITLQNDVLRLYNLGLFNKVEFLPLPAGDDKFNLIITVSENFYILPLPQAGFKEGDFTKFWAGMNLMWRNFRGMNETVNLNFGLGYEPFIYANYSNPWLGKNDHFFTNFSVGYSNTNNRNVFREDTVNSVLTKDDLQQYKLNNFNSSFTIGKYLTKFANVNASLGYNFLSVSENANGRTISPDGKDSYLSFTAGFNYDKRNLYNYTTSGTYADIKYYKFGIFHNQIDLNRVCLDLREFIPLNLFKNFSVTLASRLVTSNAIGGSMPVYLRESFGFDKIIRGWKDNVFDGENLLGLFTELRIPVIKPFLVDGKRHIIFNKFSILRNFSYRYGMFVTAFFDVGNTYNREDNIMDVHFRNGFGVGLNFLLPFDVVARIDLAARKQNSVYYSQFIFSLASSF